MYPSVAGRTGYSQILDYEPTENGTMVSRRRVNHYGQEQTVEFRITSINHNQVEKQIEMFELPKKIAELVRNSAG